MIHSMAGGNLQKVSYDDYAKVKITSGANAGDIFWYLSITGAKQGDKVLVPVGFLGELQEGEILRIDKNISSQMSPVPKKRAKYINKIIK